MNRKMILDISERFRQGRKKLPTAQVDNKGNLSDFPLRLLNQFRKFGNQYWWQIVHTEKTEILQTFYCKRLSGSRHACNDNQISN
ncbi:hypothetical protein D3C80_1631780 [compost metagenome]